MATVDASIPLQVNKPEDPLESYAKTLQLAQGIESFQGQQALREAFKDSNTSTPEGQQALIKKVGAVDPKEAMALQSNFQKQRVAESTISKNEAQTKKAQWDVGAKAMETVSNVGSSVMMTYADLLHKGVPDAQARQIVSQAIPSIKAHLKGLRDPQGNPLFHAEQIDQIPDQFDPQMTMATVTDARARQQYYTQQHQNETAEEQKRHARVEEGQGQQRIGLEGARVGLERQRVGMEGQRLGMEGQRLAMAEAKDGLIRDPDHPGRYTRDPSAGLNEDDATFMAKQYLAGDKGVLQNLGRGAQGARDVVAVRKAIRAEAEKAGMKPDEVASTIAEFEGLKAGERALGTRTAAAGMAVNEASQFADLAVQASNKVNRTDYPSFNKILLAGEKGTGDKNVVQFGAYNNSLINAYARAISPSGTPTVSDKDHAREMLSTAYSKGQYSAVVDAMKKEMAAAQKSPGMVRQEFRGYGKRQIGPSETENPFQGGGTAPSSPAPSAQKSGGQDFSHLWN